MSRMVSVEAHFGAGRTLAALDPHLEGPLAADAELEFALRAGEMHAATLG